MSATARKTWISNGIFIINWQKHRNGIEVNELYFLQLTNCVIPFACYTTGEEMAAHDDSTEDALSHASFMETVD